MITSKTIKTITSITRRSKNMSTNIQHDTMTVNGIEYIRKDAAGSENPKSEYRIIIADRGWVIVGAVEELEDGLSVQNAKCIRIWGTDDERPGLGWLAANGPTSKSKIDPMGTAFIPRHAVVMTLATRSDLWQ